MARNAVDEDIPRMCREIVEEILNRCVFAKDPEKKSFVQFEHDWGPMTITIADQDGHTHAGFDEEDGCSKGQFIQQIRNALCGGPGLSWAPHAPSPRQGEHLRCHSCRH